MSEEEKPVLTKEQKVKQLQAEINVLRAEGVVNKEIHDLKKQKDDLKKAQFRLKNSKLLKFTQGIENFFKKLFRGSWGMMKAGGKMMKEVAEKTEKQMEATKRLNAQARQPLRQPRPLPPQRFPQSQSIMPVQQPQPPRVIYVPQPLPQTMQTPPQPKKKKAKPKQQPSNSIQEVAGEKDILSGLDEEISDLDNIAQ